MIRLEKVKQHLKEVGINWVKCYNESRKYGRYVKFYHLYKDDATNEIEDIRKKAIKIIEDIFDEDIQACQVQVVVRSRYSVAIQLKQIIVEKNVMVPFINGDMKFQGDGGFPVFEMPFKEGVTKQDAIDFLMGDEDLEYLEYLEECHGSVQEYIEECDYDKIGGVWVIEKDKLNIICDNIPKIYRDSEDYLISNYMKKLIAGFAVYEIIF